MIRFPKRFRPGTVVEDLVSLVDVTPTVMDVCGLSENSEDKFPVRSRSLCSDERARRRVVFAENDRPLSAVESLRKNVPDFDAETIDRPITMFRTEQHKLIWHVDQGFGLYDP